MTSRMQTGMALIGFAVFLTVNATSVWGGVFPFFSAEFQTEQVTIVFYLSQALSLCVSFVAAIGMGYWRPHHIFHWPVARAAIPMFVGSSLLVGAMYAQEATLVLVVAAGLLLGAGCASFFVLWQVYFAAQEVERGGLLLIVGTALAAFLYFMLHLIPIAVTAFIVPLIMIPLSALCLSQDLMRIDRAQPMLEDRPQEHRNVYRQIVRTYWKSAVCLGSLGFIAGIMRAIALNNVQIGDFVNIASMMGSLVGALVLLRVWEQHSFNISIYASFRVLCPALITLLLLMPALGEPFLGLIAGVSYMFFALAFMLMMVHCIQIAQNHGVNPVFVYGFFAGIVYGFQAVGFVFGYYAETVAIMGLQPLSIVALGSVWLLAITLIVCDKYPLRLHASKGMPASSIEFLAFRRKGDSSRSRQDSSEREQDVAVVQRVETMHSALAVEKELAHPSLMGQPGGFAPVIKDRTSKKCQIIKERYLLTAREAEIMEYIARGFSVPSIAAELIISENTVKAHSKHLYTKLDVHKRQELLDVLETA